MASEEPGLIFTPTGSAEIRTQWLQDYLLGAIDTGVPEPPVEPGTDPYLIAEANSQLALVGLANISISADDANVLKATGDALDEIREAEGLPIVQPQGSSGKIRVTVSGSTTIASGTALKLPNGLRIQTVGAVTNPADQQEIDVTAIDTGTLTNLRGGDPVQFVVAPTNVEQEAFVSNEFPLSGGTDAENDSRKRERILNVRRNKPAGGNWAYWRKFVQDNFGSIQDTYVYAAPGGPSSQLIVPVRAFDRANNDYSRAPSSALIQAIRTSVQSDANSGVDTYVKAPANQTVDFTIRVTIPNSSLSGGNGQGWTDGSPWPVLEAGDANTVTITAIGDSDTITVDAVTATEPIDGQTHIAWWSKVDRKFYTALVVSHSGATTAWVLNLDRPLVGIDGIGPATGDYICPAAQNLEAYGDTWVAMFEELGPGEVTADGPRLPRAVRNPEAADEDPYSVTSKALAVISGKHPEISNISFGHSPTTSPTVPASVNDPPNILIPLKFAVYAT